MTTQKLQAEEVAKSRSQQKFMAAVSHELKTPLHGAAARPACWGDARR